MHTDTMRIPRWPRVATLAGIVGATALLGGCDRKSDCEKLPAVADRISGSKPE